MDTRLFLLIAPAVFFLACQPYANPEDGVLYSCYTDEHCVMDGYSCSGLIETPETADGKCPYSDDQSLQHLLAGNGICYFFYCRRDDDELLCGKGVCNQDQECVGLREQMIDENSTVFSAACISSDEAAQDGFMADACGGGEACGTGTCIFDLRGWASQAYGNDDITAWRCFTGEVALPH